MANTNHIVQKLWNLCDILRDGGVDYMGYVNELTFILFPKMLEEKGLDVKWLPKGYRWKDLTDKNGIEQFNFYRKMLLELGMQDSKLKKHHRVLEIYTNASTSLKQPKHLSLIISEINKIDWYSHDKDDLGDMYEGLLEKVGSEKKSGAGQYFTPRVLIESIVDLLQPQPKEEIQDPAAGTCGFLIYADKYIKNKTDNFVKLSEQDAEFQIKDAFYGIELVEITHRLALMNLMLHDMESDLIQGSALGEVGASLKPADVILSNPPFGTAKGDGGSTRSDLTFETSNKQLSFLQHIYRSLKSGGRAGVVLPDNVLFESGMGAKIRQDLMEKCNLHTILRLPTGIFYAQGVKTNVLFFNKGKKETGNTKKIWVYDLRSNMPSFGKTSPLKREHFVEFEKAYGKKADGNSKRIDQGEQGRFRCFSIDEIKKRDYNLDISWLRDDSVTHADDLPEATELSISILSSLKKSTLLMEEVDKILSEKISKYKWKTEKLKNVIEKIVGGGTPSRSVPAYFNGKIPWMSVKDMKSLSPEDTKEHITEKAVKESSTNIIPENIPIVATRMSLGKVVKVPYKTAINQDLKAIFLKPCVDINFFIRWWESNSNFIASIGKGTTVKGIRLEVINNFDFSYPDIEAQKIIVKKINFLFEKIDTANNYLQSDQHVIMLLKQSILKKAFAGKL